MAPAAQHNPNFSPNYSDRDLSSHMGPVAGTGGLFINFFYQRVKIEGHDPVKAGTVETRLCVAKKPKGDKYTVAVQFTSEEEAARNWPFEWGRFKEFEDVPTMGTPLSELPGISQSQVAYLVINGLRSVEDLVEIGEDAAGMIGMDAMRAYRLAKNWLHKKNEEQALIDASEIEARHKHERDALLKRLDVLEKTNQALAAQVKSVLSGNASPAMAGPANGPQPVTADDGLTYDIDSMDNAMFAGGVATGNDDLGDADEQVDPLAE